MDSDTRSVFQKKTFRLPAKFITVTAINHYWRIDLLLHGIIYVVNNLIIFQKLKNSAIIIFPQKTIVKWKPVELFELSVQWSFGREKCFAF